MTPPLTHACGACTLRYELCTRCVRVSKNYQPFGILVTKDDLG